MNRLLWAQAALVAFVCACAEGTTYEPQYWKAPDHAPGEGIPKDCSGELKDNGCDDCNPCTWDQWCDPETGEGDDYAPCLTQKYAGCVHSYDYTTPAGQINDCFPVADEGELRAGRCCLGACVDNAAACAIQTH